MVVTAPQQPIPSQYTPYQLPMSANVLKSQCQQLLKCPCESLLPFNLPFLVAMVTAFQVFRTVSDRSMHGGLRASWDDFLDPQSGIAYYQYQIRQEVSDRPGAGQKTIYNNITDLVTGTTLSPQKHVCASAHALLLSLSKVFCYQRLSFGSCDCVRALYCRETTHHKHCECWCRSMWDWRRLGSPKT